MTSTKSAPLIFTAPDAGLGGAGERDLLGLQPINSSLGGECAPCITGRSANGQDMTAALLLAHVAGLHHERRGAQALDYRGCIKAFEQVHAFATLSHLSGERSVHGTVKASALWREHGANAEVGLTRGHDFLVSQQATGLMGFYATPLRNSGFFGRQFRGVTWPAGTGPRTFLAGPVEEVADALEGFLVRLCEAKVLPVHEAAHGQPGGWEGFAERLCSTHVGLDEGRRSEWRRALRWHEPAPEALIRVLRDEPDLDHRQRMHALVERGEGPAGLFQRVRDCEDYLTPLEAWMEILATSDNLEQAEARARTEDGRYLFEVLQERHAAFCKVTTNNPMANGRLRGMAVANPAAGLHDFSASLLHYHADLAKGSPVVELESSGRLQRYSQAIEDETPDWWTWRRNYHAATLKQLQDAFAPEQVGGGA